MGEELKVGCARPTGAAVGESPPDGDNNDTEHQQADTRKKEEMKMIKVGQKAPDFTAPAYHKGKFINVTLSEHLGKWVILCFYPGDFTFV